MHIAHPLFVVHNDENWTYIYLENFYVYWIIRERKHNNNNNLDEAELFIRTMHILELYCSLVIVMVNF